VGLTKRGKGTKLMVVSDGNGLPLGLHLDSARPHEVTLARRTLETVRVPRRRGRPRQRSRELVADKAYDSRELRQWLRRKGIKPTIPPIERRRKRPKRGRPIQVGPGYRERWKVERLFAWLGQFRRLVVRHERLLKVFRGFVLVAFILICLRQF
jgi:transposase